MLSWLVSLCQSIWHNQTPKGPRVSFATIFATPFLTLVKGTILLLTVADRSLPKFAGTVLHLFLSFVTSSASPVPRPEILNVRG